TASLRLLYVILALHHKH
ncbi:unnamed protein product, partial [Callosobruchus maculatus]